MPLPRRFRTVVFANAGNLKHLSDEDLTITLCGKQCGWMRSGTTTPFSTEWVADPLFCQDCVALARISIMDF